MGCVMNRMHFAQGQVQRLLFMFGLMCALVLATVPVCGCSSIEINVTESSPQLEGLSMTATSDDDDAEATQRIDVVLSASETLVAADGFEDDFEVLLNGEAIDGDVIQLDVTCEGNTVTFSLTPGEAAGSGLGGSGAGEYFAVYQGAISISAARDDGALPHLTSESGDTAVLSGAVEGTLPSGMTIEIDEQVEGSTEDKTVAKTTFTVTSSAKVRAITWLSLDGGQTKLLIHNHNFSLDDESACAERIVEVINESSDYLAIARGSVVDVRAVDAVDGQIIEVLVVEGFGVTGGNYDGSTG